MGVVSCWGEALAAAPSEEQKVVVVWNGILGNWWWVEDNWGLKENDEKLEKEIMCWRK